MQTPSNYTAAVHDIADDVIRQIEDNEAPAKTYTVQCAGGQHEPHARVFYADLPRGWWPTIPGGVVRVSLDVGPIRSRTPSHAVAVAFHEHDYDSGEAAADIAAAVLDLIDNNAPYAN